MSPAERQLRIKLLLMKGEALRTKLRLEKKHLKSHPFKSGFEFIQDSPIQRIIKPGLALWIRLAPKSKMRNFIQKCAKSVKVGAYISALLQRF